MTINGSMGSQSYRVIESLEPVVRLVVFLTHATLFYGHKKEAVYEGKGDGCG